jgi:hypothetical protein
VGIAEVKASIEASDIGTDYVWRVHPPGISIQEHLYASMRAGRDTGAELVLRFEDDVLVNRHILHNIRTWPALEDPRFGMGWLFDPASMTGARMPHRTRGRKHGADYWSTEILPFSQAVLMRSADIDELIKHSMHYYKTRASYDGEQDLALSYAALAMGKQIAVHSPSLTEHRIDEMPSQLGHQHCKAWGSSRGSFDPEFKRGAPLYDRYGRVVERWR